MEKRGREMVTQRSVIEEQAHLNESQATVIHEQREQLASLAARLERLEAELPGDGGVAR